MSLMKPWRVGKRHKPPEVLSSTGELEHRASGWGSESEPLGHLSSIVKFVGKSGSIGPWSCPRVLGVGSVDELEAPCVLGGEGR